MVTALGDASGAEQAAAAVALASGCGSILILETRPGRPRPRAGLLASAEAKALEHACHDIEGLEVRARGRACFGAPAGPGDTERVTVAAVEIAALCVVIATPENVQPLCRALERAGRPATLLVRSDLRNDRSLTALLVAEAQERGWETHVWKRRPGGVAARRLAAGLDPGGWVAAAGRRTAARLLGDQGQAAPLTLFAAIAVIAAALILVAVGSGATAKARLQRAVDLAALSAARSMRDDFDRLFVPARRLDGTPNPAHLSRGEYLDRSRRAALLAVERNGGPAAGASITFPDAESFAPLHVEVEIEADVRTGSETAETAVGAEAAVSPPTAAIPVGSGGCPTRASGGGYGGPLACRQGKPMRPDVAAAFDRMSAAASGAGVVLLVNSGFRSDAEQAVLFAANPDPRMVAPPGQSLHRCGTELDLGPPSAYGWLAANAGRFGFLQRYSWEAWHYGYADGPDPCSAAAESGEIPSTGGPRLGGDGRGSGSEGLPGFVPAAYREPLEASAVRHGVSAALLAAQLMAESNFNPSAVSPAGAQGIAQFMPATAVAYGLDDPFDPVAAIDAQARLMSDLLGQFGGLVELALAGYNAGPAPVLACSCVPAYPETQAYVARIMGLLRGTGALAGAPVSTLEVRLVG